jgi:hypothetical protein
MIVELRRAPGVDALLGLKESLDFASSAWSALFCRMGGAALLAQACLGFGCFWFGLVWFEGCARRGEESKGGGRQGAESEQGG